MYLLFSSDIKDRWIFSTYHGKLLKKCLIKPLRLAADLFYAETKRTDEETNIRKLIIRSPDNFSDFN